MRMQPSNGSFVRSAAIKYQIARLFVSDDRSEPIADVDDFYPRGVKAKGRRAITRPPPGLVIG